MKTLKSSILLVISLYFLITVFLGASWTAFGISILLSVLAGVNQGSGCIGKNKFILTFLGPLGICSLIFLVTFIEHGLSAAFVWIGVLLLQGIAYSAGIIVRSVLMKKNNSIPTSREKNRKVN